MKKGYKPITSQADLAQLVKNLTALRGLEEELLEHAEGGSNRQITRQELMRDLGFTPSALRLLAKSKWFAPDSNGSSRETYDFKTALRVRVLFSGFAGAPQVRTERKRSNITSVMKETFWKIVWKSNSPTLKDAPPHESQKRTRSRLPKGQRTPSRDYYLFILNALDVCGGSARLPDVLTRLELSMKDSLKPIDFEPMPSHPTVPRWHNAAQWARYEMVKSGLLKSDSPRGLWEITEAGKKFVRKSVS